MLIDRNVVARVARLFVHRCRLRHIIAFCEWRRDFKSTKKKLSLESLAQIEEIIETNAAYLQRMNDMANDGIRQYCMESMELPEQNKFLLDSDLLLDIFLGKNRRPNANLVKPHLIDSLSELGIP